MKWEYDNGGRPDCLPKAKGDCVTRAIAIATEIDYVIVREMILDLAKNERKGKRKHGISCPDSGVYIRTIRKIMTEIVGWEWTPTMFIGSGCKVHLRDGELPDGRLVLSLSRHITAVVDGVIRDTYDPSRDGTRCVYGYWKKARS